jgi:phage/plasmid-like protein (TIGR03299 family)
MSRETLEWSNVWTLIGDTDLYASGQRDDSFRLANGKAWTYRESMQGDEPNHYPGAIPVEDVERRLFGWDPVAVSPMTASYSIITEDGVELVTVTDKNRQMIVRPRGALGPDDQGGILGVFKAGYKIHNFREWLIKNVETILDDTLHISSAGLLREAAQAWVGISVPENIVTPEGVEFRPFIYAATSLDGSLATGYGASAQLPVCDNSLAIARGEQGRKIKHKHTVNSLANIGKVRDALSIQFAHAAMDEAAQSFATEVAELTNTTVTDAQWQSFQDELFGAVPKETGRARTMAQNKRAEMEQLYRYDERCKMWTGTAFGVLQAVNTWSHHCQIVRGASRPQRNADRVITGGVDALDNATLTTLEKVLA